MPREWIAKKDYGIRKQWGTPRIIKEQRRLDLGLQDRTAHCLPPELAAQTLGLEPDCVRSGRKRAELLHSPVQDVKIQRRK